MGGAMIESDGKHQNDSIFQNNNDEEQFCPGSCIVEVGFVFKKSLGSVTEIFPLAPPCKNKQTNKNNNKKYVMVHGIMELDAFRNKEQRVKDLL